MRVTFAILAAAVLFSSTLARADDQSRLATARELVRLNHANENMRSLLPMLDKQLRPALLQQSGNNAKPVDQFMTRVEQRFAQNVDNVTDLRAQVYARELSEDDLDAYVTFYKSSAGQHLVEKQVVIASGLIAVGQQWGAKVVQETLQEFKQQQSNAAAKL